MAWLKAMNDTTPQAMEAQMNALRAMTPSRRLALAVGWSQSIRGMITQRLKADHPELPSEDLRRMLAERLMGRELATRVYGPGESHG